MEKGLEVCLATEWVENLHLVKLNYIRKERKKYQQCDWATPRNYTYIHLNRNGIVQTARRA